MHPHKLFLLSSRFYNLYFCTAAGQGGTSYLILDLRVGRKDAVFTLPAVGCTRQTLAVRGAGLKKLYDLTCNRSAASSPVVNVPGTLQLGTSQSTLECPYSNGDSPIAAGGTRCLREGWAGPIQLKRQQKHALLVVCFWFPCMGFWLIFRCCCQLLQS